MALSNSKKLEILRKAKNGGYRGNYLDLFKRYEEGGLPTVNVPEVEISALKDETYDKLSQAQKKLYDLYQTPQGTRQTLPITVGRDREVTQDIHYLDALNLSARNPFTQIIDKPYKPPFFDKKFKMKPDGLFRPHAQPATKNIYIPSLDAYTSRASRFNKYVVVDPEGNPTDLNFSNPKTKKLMYSSGEYDLYNPDYPQYKELLESNPAFKAQMLKNQARPVTPAQLEKAASERLKMSFEEYAHIDDDVNHPMQNLFGTAITYGDRIRRGIKEKGFPDASNYSSKYDFEYHTHHSPNSAVNQLVDRYGMDQYDMVNKKPTLGQYNFPIIEGTTADYIERLRPDYDPGITKFENGGPHADIPPYEFLTDFQKQNIGSSTYDTFVNHLGDNREFVPGPGGTLDSLAMNTLYETTKYKMQPGPRVYVRSEYMKNKEDLAQQLKELQGKYPESKFEIQRDPFGREKYYVAETQRHGKDFYVRGKNESEMQKDLDLLKQGHQGIMPHANPKFLEKLYEYKKHVEDNPEDFADEPDILEGINANIASREGKDPEYILGETISNIFSKTNNEKYIADNAINIHGDDPLYSHGVSIPMYEKPVGRSIRPPKIPEIQMMPTIPAGPIPTNTGEFEMQKIPTPTFPDTGPSKSDLFFQGLKNAQVYYNRPDEFTRGRRQGDSTVSTQYVFSPNNPFIPKKGQYFMSEANTRGKRKTYGDLDKARQWEREQGLGTQTYLRGYDVGNTFKHGGFSRFFNKDYSKYTKGTK